MPRKAPRPTIGLLAAAGVVLMLLMLPATALAQGYGPTADVWPQCTFGCTAEDVDLTEYFLVETTSCTPLATGSCSAGQPVDVFICATFHSNANADRTAIILLAKGVEVPLVGDPVQLFDFYGTDGNISPYAGYCAPDKITPGGDWTGVIFEPSSGFQWTCGDELQVNDSVLSWETSREAESRAPTSCRTAPHAAPRSAGSGTRHHRPSAAGRPLHLWADLRRRRSSVHRPHHGRRVAVHLRVVVRLGRDRGTPPAVDSTEQNPVHTYVAAGTYDVTLRVTDSTQATNTQTQMAIVVHSNPTAGISFNSANPPVNWQYLFSDASTPATGDYACNDPNADLTTWAWDFDDGQTSALQDRRSG